ncbi:hypothetical protein MTO96_040754 [Rhipicephalus appendiculatus]
MLQEEGRSRKKRLTEQLNEILRRIRIIRGAELLTSCTRKYLDSLEETYDHLLKLKTSRPTQPQGHHENPFYTGTRGVCRNGGIQIAEAKRPDGSIATDPQEIAAIFQNHFSSLFQESDPREDETALSHVKELCQNLRHPEQEELSDLCRAATMEDRVAVIPPRIASQLNKIIGHLLRDGKPAPIKRNLLYLPASEGGPRLA